MPPKQQEETYFSQTLYKIDKIPLKMTTHISTDVIFSGARLQ